MGISGGPYIVRDSSLVLELDAADKNSYPGSGTTWIDVSGNGNNATLINSPTFDSSNNGCIVFNGTNQYANTDGAYKFNTAAGTISYWFKPITNITATVNKRPWGQGGDFEARFSNTGGGQSGALQHDIGSSAVNYLTSTTTSWSNTRWYNVTITWDTSVTRQSIYVQSILESTSTSVSSATLAAITTTNLYIATSTGITGQYIDARFATFTAYNRELSTSEVLQNYEAQKSRFGL